VQEWFHDLVRSHFYGGLKVSQQWGMPTGTLAGQYDAVPMVRAWEYVQARWMCWCVLECLETLGAACCVTTGSMQHTPHILDVLGGACHN
jgi:hypothetical protein